MPPNLTFSQTDTVTTDRVDVVFYQGPQQVPGNIDVVQVNGSNRDWVSIVMKKDFFTPPDMCTVVIESDRPNKYTKYMQRGARVDIYLNGNINLRGFIFDYKYEYTRTSTKLTVECKDLLEFMAQGSIPPNANGNFLTSFHFPATSTLQQCLQGIIGIFISALQNNTDGSIPTQLQLAYGDNNPTAGTKIGPLSIATGFAAGIRTAGKASKNFTKSVNKALGRLNQPEKGESYLHMMQRLVKLSGGNIKMAPGTVDTIVVQSPTYDRDVAPLYQINHYLSGDNTKLNNVMDVGKLHFSLDKQHSVIVVEGNSLDENQFHLTDDKAVSVNELSGYSLVSFQDFQNGIVKLVPTTSDFIKQMTLFTSQNVLTNTPPIGPNYQFTPFSKQLYQQRYNLGIDINTSICMPRYEVSHQAHSTEQLAFESAMLLAEEQDKAVQFTYKIQGWTYHGAVWQPNQLVNVVEESLSPGNPLRLLMWIKEVTYHKDRHEGTYVEVVCTLPYTHNFELSTVSQNVTPPAQSVGKQSGYLSVPEILIEGTPSSLPTGIIFGAENAGVIK